MRRVAHLPSIAGVDEAGRGPLAGPVFVAAVVLPQRYRLPGLNDSKQLSRKKREELEALIRKQAIDFSIVQVELEEIYRLNILWASMEGMCRAIEGLKNPPEKAVLDGNTLPKRRVCPMEAIVDGDAKHPSIAAASILAKVSRDRHMEGLAREYPVYGFDRNFGYSTPEHLEALQKHGPCPVHRMTFGPCSQLSLDMWESSPS